MKDTYMFFFVCFFVGLAISRCLSTTPHPMNRARGSILLVLCSTIILLAHHFLVFSGGCEVRSHSYLQPARPPQNPFQDEQKSELK